LANHEDYGALPIGSIPSLATQVVFCQVELDDHVAQFTRTLDRRIVKRLRFEFAFQPRRARGVVVDPDIVDDEGQRPHKVGTKSRGTQEAVLNPQDGRVQRERWRIGAAPDGNRGRRLRWRDGRGRFREHHIRALQKALDEGPLPA
jgi:hypothetical protein